MFSTRLKENIGLYDRIITLDTSSGKGNVRPSVCPIFFPFF